MHVCQIAMKQECISYKVKVIRMYAHGVHKIMYCFYVHMFVLDG